MANKNVWNDANKDSRMFCHGDVVSIGVVQNVTSETGW